MKPLLARCAICAVMALAWLVLGTRLALAGLLGQDFAGSINSTTYIGVTGSVVYSLPAVQLPAVQVPAVQFSFVIGSLGLSFSFPPSPCDSSGSCVDLSLDSNGVLSGINGSVPSGATSRTLFLTGQYFYIADTDPPSTICPVSATYCGSLDFSNSSPYAVPEPPSPLLFGAGLGTMVLVQRRRKRRIAAPV